MNRIRLSEYQIDGVIRIASHCWDATKGFRGETRKKYLMEDLRRFLYIEGSGLKEDVCHECLGTGYNAKARGEVEG